MKLYNLYGKYFTQRFFPFKCFEINILNELIAENTLLMSVYFASLRLCVKNLFPGKNLAR